MNSIVRFVERTGKAHKCYAKGDYAMIFYQGIDKVRQAVYLARDRDKIPAVHSLKILTDYDLQSIGDYAAHWTAAGYNVDLDRSPVERLCRACARDYGKENACVATVLAIVDSILGPDMQAFREVCEEHGIVLHERGWDTYDLD